ncbi:unnamed protein product [Owenia fusiformis]|uniref:Uncharacterized protein n=1 Tax=Owenia fusiformis TaxID=6347 RepID=A0A8J1UKC1_OWEFU|nr:unnamed protein product [Owenia fusiformis]
MDRGISETKLQIHLKSYKNNNSKSNNNNNNTSTKTATTMIKTTTATTKLTTMSTTMTTTKTKSDSRGKKNIDGNAGKNSYEKSLTSQLLDLRKILKENSVAKNKELIQYMNKRKKSYNYSQIFKNILCYPRTKSLINFEKLIVNIEKSLTRINSKYGPINFLYANADRLQELINWWLMAKFVAKMELNNLIVATDSTKLTPILSKLSINTVFIDTTITQTEIERIHKNIIWLYRIIFWRLLNSYGYDVLCFDTDAIVLNDPISHIEKNYPDASIVASMTNKAPKNVNHEWGFTLCMGLVLFRKEMNSQRSFWGFLDDMCTARLVHVVGDQRLINEVLIGEGIKWNVNYKEQQEKIDLGNILVTGKTTDGLIVKVLSPNDFCRLACHKGQTQYVWHKRTEHKNWLLKNDWEKLLTKVNDIRMLVNMTLYLDLKDYNIAITDLFDDERPKEKFKDFDRQRSSN